MTEYEIKASRYIRDLLRMRHHRIIRQNTPSRLGVWNGYIWEDYSENRWIWKRLPKGSYQFPVRAPHRHATRNG